MPNNVCTLCNAPADCTIWRDEVVVTGRDEGQLYLSAKSIMVAALCEEHLDLSEHFTCNIRVEREIEDGDRPESPFE